MIDKDYRVNILGCPVDNLSMQETLCVAEEMIKSRRVHQHVVINVDKLLKFRRDPLLREIIFNCDIINADGMPIIWASRILGRPLKEKVSGIDLMETLIALASKKGYKVYFLGAKEKIVKKVVEIYKSRYSGLLIAGFRNGYWEQSQEQEVAENIRDSKPDILFVAITSPQKEFFLRKYLNIMQVPFVMGVGGSFDIVAGLTKRAPKWMQKIGLEWLYRLIQEPHRLWRRYLIGNSLFIFLVLKEIGIRLCRCLITQIKK